jgi:hypothetical protein
VFKISRQVNELLVTSYFASQLQVRRKQVGKNGCNSFYIRLTVKIVYFVMNLSFDNILFFIKEIMKLVLFIIIYNSIFCLRISLSKLSR